MVPKALAVLLAVATAFSVGEMTRLLSTGLTTHLAATAAQGALESRMSAHVAALCRRGGAHTDVACRRQLDMAGF